MAALPYMQLYVADYLADTQHLTTEEHGAYILLIFSYWQTGKPLRIDRLATVARLSNERWTDVEETLKEFFHVVGAHWHHFRIDADLDAVNSKASKASDAGKASAKARALKKQQESNERSTDVETNVEQTYQRNGNHTDTDTDTDTDTEDQKPLVTVVTGDDKTNKPDPLQGFSEFWIKYPRKVGKCNAEKAWAKLRPSIELQSEILAAIETQSKSVGWLKDGGEFIPHPATWLNQRRWNDQLPAAPLSKHGDFDKRNYYEGLTQREDGSYAF